MIYLHMLYDLSISGAHLFCFKSNLSDRSSSVQIGESLSSTIPITCEVLGPLLFTLYIIQLSILIQLFMIYLIIFMMMTFSFKTTS